jgi:hypothetical protein
MQKFNIENLQTGDILLFSNIFKWYNPMTWFGKAIELGTKSPYSHIGIILKSPTYIDEKLNGIYLWESDADFTKDAETNEIILGVKLTPIHDVLDWKEYIYLKKLNKDYNYKFDQESIKTIYNATKNIPYDLDIKDWIAAFFRSKLIKTDKKFFCSAFVSFILVQLGLLKLNCDFSIIQPRDYDTNYSNYLHDYWIYNLTYSNNLIQLK